MLEYRAGHAVALYFWKLEKKKIPVDSNTQLVEHIHTSLPKTA